MELQESVSEDVGADLNEAFDTFIENKVCLFFKYCNLELA